MKIATASHRYIVVDILSKSFDDNQSINYIVKQDHLRKERIKELMSYSFDVCLAKGQIFISDDEQACGLILHPEGKIGWLKTIRLDFNLAINSIGITRVGKVLKRERQIKIHQPKCSFYYLWFIGVHPDSQGKGIGSKFIEDIFHEYDIEKKPFYLETSVIRNLAWYEKYGFKVFNQLNIGYKLYQMLRD